MTSMKRLLATALSAALALALAAPTLAQSDAQQQLAQEDQIGKQVYDELAQKGEIIHQSPYYATLAPIARQIKRIADPQYGRPFTFILVHEKNPNAFAVPGGNVYVTDSLMTFVENREELAGVLCHETSHTIHHDVINNMMKDQRAQQNTAIGATLLNILTGGRASNVIGTIANFDLATVVSKYSRTVETAADLKGSDTCAEAGSNPYGMVWLFQRFEKQSSGGSAEFLSDHPNDDHRINALEEHFAQNPSLFRRFNPSIARATRLNVPHVVTEYAPDPQPTQ